MFGCCAWRAYELFEVNHPPHLSLSSSLTRYADENGARGQRITIDIMVLSCPKKKGEAVKSPRVHTQEILHDRLCSSRYVFFIFFMQLFKVLANRLAATDLY